MRESATRLTFCPSNRRAFWVPWDTSSVHAVPFVKYNAERPALVPPAGTLVCLNLTRGKCLILGAQSGVSKSVPADSFYFGYPAKDHRKAKKIEVFVKKLPEIYTRLKELESKFKSWFVTALTGNIFTSRTVIICRIINLQKLINCSNFYTCFMKNYYLI